MRLGRAWIAAAAVVLAIAPVAYASFAGDGYETVDFGAVDDPGAVAVQSDGKIVAVGGTSAGSSNFDFATARLTKSGDPDASWPAKGRIVTDIDDFDTANDVAIQKDGKIVVAGVAAIGSGTKMALVRYRKGGGLDDTFSGNGIATTTFAGGVSAEAMAIQKDGKIVVAGGSAGDDFALARFRPNGRLDKSFSGDGKVTTSFGHPAGARAVAIQRHGKIVAAGDACKVDGMCPSDFALARYTRRGKLDRSFGGDGRVRRNLGGGDSVNDLAIRDGKIIAAGIARPGGDSDFGLARFKSNGKPDRSFSRDGKVTTDFGSDDNANAMVLDRRGRIVLGGGTGFIDTTFAFARYTPSGRLDRSFGGDGKRTPTLPGFDTTASDIAFQGRRRLIAVGYATAGQDFLIARFHANGTLFD